MQNGTEDQVHSETRHQATAKSARCRCKLGQRHVLVLCCSFGLAILYIQRVAFSVTLVAMVNGTTSSKHPQPVELSLNLVDHSFTWSKEMQGLLLSAFFWGYIILQVPAGTLAQRYGAKWLLGSGVLASSLITSIIPLAARLGEYFLFSAIAAQGIAASIALPACMAMLGRWVPPKEASFLLSVALSGGYLGTIIGQIVAGALSASALLGGWPSVFYVNGTAGVFWLLPWGFLVSNSPSGHPRISEEEKHYIKTAIGSNQSQENTDGVPWSRLFLSRAIWVYHIMSVLACWVAYSLMACLPQYLSEALGYNIASDGLVASLPFLGAFIGSNIFPYLSDTLASRPWPGKTPVRKIFTLLALWSCAACFLGMTFAIKLKLGRPLAVGLLVLGYTLNSGIYGGYYSAPLDICPEYSGTIFGIRNIFTAIAGIAVPIVNDHLTPNGTEEEWVQIFYINIGAAAAAGLLFVLVGSADRQVWHHSDRSDDKESEETEPLFAVEVHSERQNVEETVYGTVINVRS